MTKTLGFVPQENGKRIHAMAKEFQIVMERLLPFYNTTSIYPSVADWSVDCHMQNIQLLQKR